MFNLAIKVDVPVKNPISKTGAKAVQENAEKNRTLTFGEQDKYLAVATPMLRDVASLMLETGMRPEEVCRIQPRNVNLIASTLFNPYAKTKAAKRLIQLTDGARSILEARMSACKGTICSLIRRTYIAQFLGSTMLTTGH